MNYLGIDYGATKIGLAKAESELRIAVPFRTVLNTPDVIDELERIILVEGFEQIIIGYPLTLAGEVGEQAKEVDDFIVRLKTLSLPVMKQDERFSTKSAVSAGEDHASAAALILQTYLDGHKDLSPRSYDL